ncbi:MAG: DNA repair protein RadC [Candidatus Azobacteroides sp.]|nr:DNA repair protein RadC [Candidatus Azobacteroides sp.]
MEENKKGTIKDWDEEDRPREKMLRKGIQLLTNAELIAILINSGNKEETSVEVAQKILFSCQNNLNELGKYTLSDLCKFRGIGKAKAISIICAMEIGRRRMSNEAVKKQQILSSYDMFELFFPDMCDLPFEEMWVVLLNRSKKILVKQKISQGGISSTTVDIRLIIKLALEACASAIIICHNHPSGNKSPSLDDRKLTLKIKESAKMMDLQLLDHIIIADDTYFSFADEGLI